MRGHDNADVPTPQQLAAYSDGELDPAARARIADWLVHHPDRAADLEAQRVADRLCRAVPLPEPAQPAWDGVLKRIDQKTQIIRAARRPVSPWALWPAVGLAAAVLIAVLLWWPTGQLPPVVVVPAPVKAWAVARDADIDIVSIEAADVRLLAVGEQPFVGFVVLAGPNEITLEKIEPDDLDGMLPKKVNMNEGTGTPMIVAPLALARSGP